MISLNGAVDVSFPKTNQEKNPRSFVTAGQSIIVVTVSYAGSSYSGRQTFASTLPLTIRPANAVVHSAKLASRIALTQLDTRWRVLFAKKKQLSRRIESIVRHPTEIYRIIVQLAVRRMTRSVAHVQ